MPQGTSLANRLSIPKPYPCLHWNNSRPLTAAYNPAPIFRLTFRQSKPWASPRTRLVTDGHAAFHSIGNDTLSTGARYETLPIAEQTDAEQFKADLKAHQQGETDYLTFCTTVPGQALPNR
jgi:hypothetical protein